MDHPLPHGLSDGGRRYDDDVMERRKLHLGRAKALGNLCAEYTFYTPALLHLYARLTFDPLVEFYHDYKKDFKVFTRTFAEPLFKGLAMPDDASWNHVLYAIGNDAWPAFQNWLRALTMVDRERDLLLRVRVSPLDITDPLLWESRDPLLVTEKLPINVLCLETNKGSYYLDTPIGATRPQAMYLRKVFDDTQALANTVLYGMPLEVEYSVPAGNLKLPVAIGFDSLPAAKQAEILAAIKETREHMKGMS